MFAPQVSAGAVVSAVRLYEAFFIVAGAPR